MGDHRDAQSGISYGDVASTARAIGRLYHGNVDFILALPVRDGHGVVLDVRCRFRRGLDGTGSGHFERGASGRWPSGQSSTLAGLLFRLLYELEYKLEVEAEEAQREAIAQRRFC